MENTVGQMEIMALDTKIGTDTLEAVRKMIPEERKLNLEKVMWELKNSPEGSVPDPEHAAPYTLSLIHIWENLQCRKCLLPKRRRTACLDPVDNPRNSTNCYDHGSCEWKRTGG